nr:uncharacterized protein LOC128690214 [Cherax quadricarinatus]
MEEIFTLKEKLSSVSIKYMKIDDRTLKRYLKAFRSVDAAYEGILVTNAWRRDFGVANITRDTPGVKRVMETKVCEILNHRDKNQRPVAYVAVENHNMQRRNVDDMILYIVYMLETASSKCLEDGPDNVCILFDMKNFSMMCMDYTVLKSLYTIMTTHYPERLGVCLVLNAPLIFSACWIIIRSWLDDNTAGKIQFIKSRDDLCFYLDPALLPINF